MAKITENYQKQLRRDDAQVQTCLQTVSILVTDERTITAVRNAATWTRTGHHLSSKQLRRRMLYFVLLLSRVP